MTWYFNVADSERRIPVNIDPVAGRLPAGQPDLGNAQFAVVVIIYNQSLGDGADGRKHGVKKDRIGRKSQS